MIRQAPWTWKLFLRPFSKFILPPVFCRVRCRPRPAIPTTRGRSWRTFLLLLHRLTRLTLVVVVGPLLGGLVPGTLAPPLPQPCLPTACSSAQPWEPPFGSPARSGLGPPAWRQAKCSGMRLTACPLLRSYQSKVECTLCCAPPHLGNPSSSGPSVSSSPTPASSVPGRFATASLPKGRPVFTAEPPRCPSLSQLRSNERQRAFVRLLGPFGALHRESTSGWGPPRRRCLGFVCSAFTTRGRLPCLPPHRICAAKPVSFWPGSLSCGTAWAIDHPGSAIPGGGRGRSRRTYLRNPVSSGHRRGQRSCRTHDALRPCRWGLRCSFRPRAASEVPGGKPAFSPHPSLASQPGRRPNGLLLCRRRCGGRSARGRSTGACSSFSGRPQESSSQSEEGDNKPAGNSDRPAAVGDAPPHRSTAAARGPPASPQRPALKDQSPRTRCRSPSPRTSQAPDLPLPLQASCWALLQRRDRRKPQPQGHPRPMQISSWGP